MKIPKMFLKGKSSYRPFSIIPTFSSSNESFIIIPNSFRFSKLIQLLQEIGFEKIYFNFDSNKPQFQLLDDSKICLVIFDVSKLLFSNPTNKKYTLLLSDFPETKSFSDKASLKIIFNNSNIIFRESFYQTSQTENTLKEISILKEQTIKSSSINETLIEEMIFKTEKLENLVKSFTQFTIPRKYLLFLNKGTLSYNFSIRISEKYLEIYDTTLKTKDLSNLIFSRKIMSEFGFYEESYFISNYLLILQDLNKEEKITFFLRTDNPLGIEFLFWGIKIKSFIAPKIEIENTKKSEISIAKMFDFSITDFIGGA